MENILPKHLPEIVFSSSNSGISKQISILEKRGKLRKIAARIYTSNFVDDPAIVISRNIFEIIGKLYPGSLLSHRSAMEFKPTSAGHLFITYSYTKKIKLPGLILRFLAGVGPIKGDHPISGDLYVSQLERALLENLQVSRNTGPESKLIPLVDLEERLEQILRINGEKGLNELREKARQISNELNLKTEFEKLNRLISALLSSKPSKILSSPLAIARALGNPYDASRINLFEKLFIELNQNDFLDIPEKNRTKKSFTNFAFFEAYFSNYIEGTEFEIDEARKIIDTKTPLASRNEDSHDILGTYELVSNKVEMNKLSQDPDQFIDILLIRHKKLLSARVNKNPGAFKHINNRAGETYFVDHELVKGTLIKGFDFYKALKHPFSKASFMMFLISEIHPFLDGNGRIARVMMNAELVHTEQTKIIIPTVYRDDYLGALRKLTRKLDPKPYIKMLAMAQKFSSTIIGDDFEDMENHLKASNAFKSHDEGKLKIIDN